MGNQAAYLQARLRRDAPEVFADWEGLCWQYLQQPPEWVDWLIQGVRVTSGKVTKADDLVAAGLSEQAQCIAGQMLAMESSTFAKPGDNQHSLREGGLHIMQTTEYGHGTSAAYLAVRLKKAERDDLLHEIGPGKRFKSIRAAARPLLEPRLGGPGRGHKSHDSVMAFQGNSQQYLLRRIARDQPTLLDESRVAERHSKAASTVSSESWDRILPRLARDAPQILERVKSGEIKSDYIMIAFMPLPGPFQGDHITLTFFLLSFGPKVDPLGTSPIIIRLVFLNSLPQ